MPWRLRHPVRHSNSCTDRYHYPTTSTYTAATSPATYSYPLAYTNYFLCAAGDWWQLGDEKVKDSSLYGEGSICSASAISPKCVRRRFALLEMSQFRINKP